MSDATVADAPIDKPFNAADAGEVQRRNSELGRRRKRVEDGLKQIIESSNGRLWLWDLLVACHTFEQPFAGEAPQTTAFRLGEHNIGLRIIAQLTRVSPDSFINMMKENADG